MEKIAFTPIWVERYMLGQMSTTRSNQLLGIGIAAVSMLSFAITYALYKASVAYIPNTLVISMQSFFSLCILTPCVLYKKISLSDTSKLRFLCFRGLIGLVGLSLLSFSLETTSLSEATLLSNAAPLFIPLLAWLFLNEKIQHSALPYLALGFLGIGVVLHPGTLHLNIGLWAALLSGVTVALVAILTKHVAHEPFLRSLFYYFSIIFLGTAPFALVSWTTPPPIVWMFLVFAGITAVLAQGLLAIAARYLSAQKIGVACYLIVLFSVIIGLIVWGTEFSLISIMGMAIVIFSGIMVLKFSTKKTLDDAIVLFDPFGSSTPLKETAQDLDFHVIGVFSRPETIYQKFKLSKELLSKHCDSVIIEEDEEKVLKKLKDFPLPIRACIPGSEGGVEQADRAASFLGLSKIPEDIALARRDKGLMRSVLQKSGLPCPDFAICKTIQELESFAKEHTFPLVIKTPKGAASDLVFICHDLESLTNHFQEIIETKDVYGSQPREAVVEEFIGGKEYVVNTFSTGEKVIVTDVWYYEKLAVSDHLRLYYRTVLIPLTEPSIQALIDYAKKIPPLFHVDKGRAHMEIKEDPKKGPMLIEVGARLSGGYLPALIKKYSNFDPFKSLIEVFTKEKIEFPDDITYTKHLAHVACPIAEGGKVVRIHGVKEIKSLPSYEAHILTFKEGDALFKTRYLFDLPCQVLLAHTDREQLLKDIDQVHSLFSIEFDDGRRSSIPEGTLV